MRQRRRSPFETPAGTEDWKTIPQRATKPSLIITAPDRKSIGKGLSAYQLLFARTTISPPSSPMT
jgi:hypothetical protein